MTSTANIFLSFVQCAYSDGFVECAFSGGFDMTGMATRKAEQGYIVEGRNEERQVFASYYNQTVSIF